MEITEHTSLILDGNYTHGKHKIEWALIKDLKKKSISKRWGHEEIRAIVKNYAEDVCYGSLRRSLQKKYSYMFTKIGLENVARDILSKTDMITWLSLAKKHKLLPHYIRPTHVVGDMQSINAILNFKSIKNKQHLYIYLSMLRYLQEEPGLVKIVVHLVKDLKIDYFIAFAVGCYHGVRYEGHSIVPYRAPYPAPKKAAKAEYSLLYSRRLKEFIKDPLKYGDKNLFTDTYWDMEGSLKKIKTKNKLVNFEGLDTEKAIKFVNSTEKKNEKGK